MHAPTHCPRILSLLSLLQIRIVPRPDLSPKIVALVHKLAEAKACPNCKFYRHEPTPEVRSSSLRPQGRRASVPCTVVPAWGGAVSGTPGTARMQRPAPAASFTDMNLPPR